MGWVWWQVVQQVGFQCSVLGRGDSFLSEEVRDGGGGNREAVLAEEPADGSNAVSLFPKYLCDFALALEWGVGWDGFGSGFDCRQFVLIDCVHVSFLSGAGLFWFFALRSSDPPHFSEKKSTGLLAGGFSSGFLAFGVLAVELLVFLVGFVEQLGGLVEIFL
jgi:hypothetical protein